MDGCVFCKITNKEIPAEIIFENDNFVVFKDINPKSRIHFLIVSKKHIHSVAHIKDEDAGLAGQMILTARDTAKKLGLSGYKLLFNVGRGAGQVVDHIHLHLLAD